MATGYDNSTEVLLQKLEQRFPLDIRKQIEFVDDMLVTSGHMLPPETVQEWKNVHETLWQRVTQMQNGSAGTMLMQKRINEQDSIIAEMRRQLAELTATVDEIQKKVNAQDTLVMQLSAKLMNEDCPIDNERLQAICNTPSTIRIGRGKTPLTITVHDRCKAFAYFMKFNHRIINQDSTARLMQLFSGIPYNTLKNQFTMQNLDKPYSSPEVEQWFNNELEKQV